MARQRETHSPSRSKREDDYHYDKRRRDDDRNHGRRSRSRSPDKRYRESHRTRDRSRDRRSDDHHRSYRDSSRERRKSREHGVKDHRDRSRERRRRRDGSRDRDRRRRDDSTDSKRSARRRDSKERGTTRSNVDRNEPTKATSGIADDEKKKAERLAKLEAWKQKLAEAAAEKKKKELQSAAGTRGLLAEMDKKAAATPTKVVSPADSASPESSSTLEDTSSPKPYTGKFDPKAIAKRAASNSAHAASKLGTDILLPGQVKPSASSIPVTTGVQANKTVASGITSSASSVSLKARGNLSGFGLAAKIAQESDGKLAAKKGLAFDEEENARKTLEKLPSLENSNMDEDTALTNGDKDDEDDDEEDVEIEGGTEEEAAAAARAAAEKREERLQAQNLQYQAGQELPETNGDVKMEEAPLEPVDVEMAEEEEEELDPLDAYMVGLNDDSFAQRTLAPKRKAAHEPQALFGDDDEPDMTAVDQDADSLLTVSTKKKKKDIPTVDHSKINYEPFQKSFYAEPSDLSSLTEEEVANLRLVLDGIKVKGTDVPKPAMKWSQCGLSNQIQDVISSLKFENPSAIQAQSIPAISSGRNVVGVAQTGSGKTIAFLLPMFRHIKAQRPLANMDGPIGLVMTPTRELANQIHRDCKPFLKALNLRAVVCYGGAPIKDQIAQLKTGAHIVVCTPGRMIDLLTANSGRVTNLRRVTYVVLDEADRMFDMGFEPQVKKILANCRPDRQTVLFSATFPRQMEKLAKDTLETPIEIVVGGRSVVAKEITQVVEIREEDSKFHRLLELLGKQYEDDQNEDDRVLIFVDRHEAADNLLSDLMRKGYPCQSIHGGKDQIDRNSALDDFKMGAVPILIATSVAARGLDVKQLKLVINFDAPNHLEDYVHRAGRTGRAGNTGTCVTFLIPEQDRYAVDLAKALKQSGQPIPDDLQKLADQFNEKVKAGKEKGGASGFGGKGLERLDQERDATRNRERKAYKTGDEPEEEEKEDKKDEELIKKAASAVQSANAPAPLPAVPNGIDLDGKITVHKTEKPAPSTAKNPLDRVSQAVANINKRVKGDPAAGSSAVDHNRGPDAGAFHATLEINDFPQRARWAVTNRTNVAKILEATGTSITTKGNFYPTSKQPEPGDAPKLYILVEGDTEIVVTDAMRELMRLAKDATAAAADSESRAPASGRYSVV